MREILFAPLILIAGCSSPEPIVSVEQLAGEYYSSICPPIAVQGRNLIVNGEGSPFQIIGIKTHDLLSIARTPQYVMADSCRLVLANEPAYIQIDVVNGRPTFEIASTDGGEAIPFVRGSGIR